MVNVGKYTIHGMLWVQTENHSCLPSDDFHGFHEGWWCAPVEVEGPKKQKTPSLWKMKWRIVKRFSNVQAVSPQIIELIEVEIRSNICSFSFGVLFQPLLKNKQRQVSDRRFGWLFSSRAAPWNGLCRETSRTRSWQSSNHDLRSPPGTNSWSLGEPIQKLKKHGTNLSIASVFWKTHTPHVIFVFFLNAFFFI